MELTSFECSGFAGQVICEPLSPRMILYGDNASGKTTRLKIIDWCFRGPQGKDGFLPLASSAEPMIALGGVGRGGPFRIQRSATIQDGSVKNHDDVLPSEGEHTQAAVQGRIERELNPLLFLLRLDAWLGGTSTDRRRELLQLLRGCGFTPSAKDVQMALAREKGLPADMPTPPTPEGDAFLFLERLEAWAKTQASKARATKKAVVAQLRDLEAEPLGGSAMVSKQDLETRLQELTNEIEEGIAIEQRVKAQKGRLDNAKERVAEQRDQLRRSLLQAVPNLEDYSSAPPEQIAHAIEDARKKTDQIKKAAAGKMEKMDNEELDCAGALDKSKELAARLQGYLDASRQLRDHDAGEDHCPLCRRPGFNVAELIQRETELAAQIRNASEKVKTCTTRLEEATGARVDARQLWHGLRTIRLELDRSVAHLDMVVVALKAQKEQAEAIEPWEGAEAIQQARTERERIDRDLHAWLQREALGKQRQQLKERRDTADARLASTVKLQQYAGPKILGGRLLAAVIKPLNETVSAVFERAYPGYTLEVRLEDARGNPDAQLVGTRTDTSNAISWVGLSAGQKCAALAALSVAIAEQFQDRFACLLVDADALDFGSLMNLVDALQQLGGRFQQIIVTTHHMIDLLPIKLDAYEEAGWELRRVPYHHPTPRAVTAADPV